MQMLKGYGKRGFRLDSRLPITLPILTQLLTAASQCITTTYDQCQFKAMCALAFFAFLRILTKFEYHLHRDTELFFFK